MQNRVWLLSLLVIFGIGAPTLAPSTANAQTTDQHHTAFTQPKHQRVRVINNHNLTLHDNKAYATGVPLDFISSTHGDFPMAFGTMMALPTAWPAPQSMAMTPNGKTVYILYNANGDYDHLSTAAFIVKYDITSGIMSRIEPNDPNVQQGPVFQSGLQKSLAYNAKTNQLWINAHTKGDQMVAQQVDLKTLNVVDQVNYTATQRDVTFNSTLAFDAHGNAYTAAKSTGHKRIPKDSLLLYRGKINKSGVHFKQLGLAVRHAPGSFPQALSYDAHRHQLVFVSDDATLTLPMNKKTVTPPMLHSTIFNSRREFKGLVWDERGNAYLLLNRFPEVMRWQH